MFFAGGSKNSKPGIVQTYINAIKDSAPKIILQNCEDQVLRSQFSILIIDLCLQIKQRSFFAHFSEATLSCKLKALSFKKLVKSGAIKSSRGSSTFKMCCLQIFKSSFLKIPIIWPIISFQENAQEPLN